MPCRSVVVFGVKIAQEVCRWEEEEMKMKMKDEKKMGRDERNMLSWLQSYKIAA